MPEPLAVYIHWPFCKAKCPYCDFNSHVRERVDADRWQDALLKEMEHMAAHTPGRQVASIFFGGGTPSLMSPATVQALIDAAATHWAMADDVEITLEANPTSVEAGAFKGFRAAGVNRVSLGIQSLQPEALKFLGRQHSVDEALKAVKLAAATFPRYTFDLIYALPGQSVAAWETELKEALRHAGDHLSLYQLTIEENTAFHTAYAKGNFVLPDEETAAALYERTQEIMENAALPAYEVSNHARPGEGSRHNIAYWAGSEYVGIGPGAHGRIVVDGEGAERLAPLRRESLAAPERKLNTSRVATQTIKSPERWLESVNRCGHGIEIRQPLSPEEMREEQLMMRLRLVEGFPRAGMPWIAEENIFRLRAQGLLTENAERIQTTLKGRLLLNALMAALLEPAWQRATAQS